jgi:2,5-dihydroxypyridine 5,6-dioxygenase
VLDCTVEGLLHSPELGQILGGGARVLMISNEHPEVLERIGWDDDMPRRVELGYQWISAAATMRVTSAAGTDLTVQLAGRRPPARPGSPAGRVRSPTGPAGWWRPSRPRTRSAARSCSLRAT